VGKRDIARAFGIAGTNRSTLKALLSEMEEEGLIIRVKNRRYSVATSVPPVGIVEAHSIDENGELLGKAIGWKGDNGNPRIIIVSSRKNSKHQTLAIGERALVRLKSVGTMEIEARIMKRLQEQTGTVIGVVKKTERNTEVQCVDRRGPQDIYIKDILNHNLEDGNIVLTRLEGKKVYGRPQATIEKILGNIGEPGAIETIVCANHAIPTEFSQESNAEALLAGPPDPKGREDLTSIPLVTIDDEDARDFDDAVWAEPDMSQENQGGWNLITAIADVSSYVKAGRALDQEAQKRGNSVYLPLKVIPMLPPSLSNEWCSLKPNEIRACMAVRVCVSKTGEIKHYRFIRGIMRSVARLTYREVEAYKTGGAPPPTKTIGTQIENLYGAYKALRQARINRNTLDFNLPEKRIVFGRSGEVTSIETRQHYDSHRLIEEFMITANVAAAEVLTKANAPCMYRIHDQPPLDKSETLRAYLKGLGYKLSRSRQLRPQHFQQILEKSKGTKHEEAISLMVLRSQSQAEYNPKNTGHFGLNIDRYSHFTSPIRRYSDLLVHRSLIAQLNLGSDGLSEAVAQQFPETGAHLSQTERRAVNAERSAVDRYKTLFMADKIGATFLGKISSVTRFGLFILLEESGADGLIPIRHLGQQLGERIQYESSKQALIARQADKDFGLGDAISVRLETADHVTGGLIFSLSDFDSPDVSRPRRKPFRRRHFRR